MPSNFRDLKLDVFSSHDINSLNSARLGIYVIWNVKKAKYITYHQHLIDMLFLVNVCIRFMFVVLLVVVLWLNH